MIYPLTVQAERLAGKPAVVDDRPDGTVVTWTYAELNREACRLANVFLALGLKPGERFVWCGPNSRAVVCVGRAPSIEYEVPRGQRSNKAAKKAGRLKKLYNEWSTLRRQL